MNLRSRLESSLPTDHQHLLHFIADVAGGLGYPIYIVGGSVRDLMLGRPVKDFDLTVEGEAGTLAELMLRRLGGRIMIHPKFGTARWTPTESTFERFNLPILKPEKFPPFLDFVSTRSETYLQPGALPVVKKSGIEDDLRRRDFTINAMAVRLDGFHFGQVVDIVDGRSDLERGLIRVLHPKSFVDDPTRLFRAVRYAVRYGFEIEPETLKLFDNDAKSVLNELSGERLRHEFDLIFEEVDPITALEKVKKLGLLQAIHRSFHDAHYDRLAGLNEKPAQEFGEFVVPEILSFEQTLGWVLYLMELDGSDIEDIAGRLDFPVLLTNAARAASSLYKDLPSFKDWKPSQWTFHLDKLPSLAIYGVWLAGSAPSLKEYLTKWQKIKPVTTGDDLIARGFGPGPKFKEILTRLRAAWLDGEVSSEENEKKLLNNLLDEK